MKIEMRFDQTTEAHILCDLLEEEFKSNKVRVRSLNDIENIEMTGHELLKIVRGFYEKITDKMNQCKSIG